MTAIIVTRHKPLVDWLYQHGISAPVIEQATPEQVKGKHVYGVLPMHLAAQARLITEVSMPDLTLEQRKKNAAGDLTVEEMNAAGATMRTFVVKEI
jgi:putative CRISPR-associated protein (TIGR02620 family)